jgi:hypothetical protein
VLYVGMVDIYKAIGGGWVERVRRSAESRCQ